MWHLKLKDLQEFAANIKILALRRGHLCLIRILGAFVYVVHKEKADLWACKNTDAIIAINRQQGMNY